MEKLKVGSVVKYVGKKHPHCGKQGTVVSILGDGGYEVEIGRVGELWYCTAKNLRVVK